MDFRAKFRFGVLFCQFLILCPWVHSKSVCSSILLTAKEMSIEHRKLLERFGDIMHANHLSCALVLSDGLVNVSFY